MDQLRCAVGICRGQGELNDEMGWDYDVRFGGRRREEQK